MILSYYYSDRSGHSGDHSYVPREKISRMLGHSNVVITEHYLDVLDPDDTFRINQSILFPPVKNYHNFASHLATSQNQLMFQILMDQV